MGYKQFLGVLIVAVIALSAVAPFTSAASNSLTKDDFKLTSFSKSIDYFDYVRTYLSDVGITAPSEFNNWHANVYMNYINSSGIQLFYAGLENISNSGVNAALQIPMQSFLVHYKTKSNTDALLSSSFLMLMSFQENSNNTIYSDSPDRNDTVYSSFTLGLDLSMISDLPVLNSKTTIIPLTHSADNLNWSWGMTYTNLTAFWYRTWIAPNNATYNSNALAITAYDELTFTYNLNINPTTGNVTLQENHVIGRIRDLIVNGVHYNSTGGYGLLGLVKISNTTVYDWINNNNFKMSITNYQTSVVVDRTTTSSTSGQNINGTIEASVSNSSIDTYTDMGEKIFNSDFGSKQSYKLYNYTADPTENTYNTYDSNTRTALISGYAGNKELFEYQIQFAKFLPFTVYHMSPGLYNEVKDSISNMSRADYFYTISYPTYSGFKVEHDPTFTAYATLTNDTSSNIGVYIVVTIVVVAVIAVLAVILIGRRPKQNINPTINS